MANVQDFYKSNNKALPTCIKEELNKGDGVDGLGVSIFKVISFSQIYSIY